MAVTVLLVVGDVPHREQYLAHLPAFDVDVVVAPSLLRAPDEEPGGYLAVLLDVGAAARATPGERVLLTEIERRLPTARVRWDARQDQILCLPSGPIGAGASGLADFLARAVEHRHGHRLRRHARVSLHLNVALEPDDGDPTGSLRSVTFDLSVGGCFVVTHAPWPVGARGTLTACELGDTPPIPVEVCGAVPWGLPLRVPGMGLRFVTLDVATRAAIEGLVSAASPPTFPAR